MFKKIISLTVSIIMLASTLSFVLPVAAEVETSGTVTVNGKSLGVDSANDYSFDVKNGTTYGADKIFVAYDGGVNKKTYASVTGFNALGGRYVTIGTQKQLNEEHCITSLEFYALVHESYLDCFDISVSSTKNGTYTSVGNVTKEEMPWIHTSTVANLAVYKYTVTDLVDAKYVKIAGKVIDGLGWSNYPVLGAFTYSWQVDKPVVSANVSMKVLNAVLDGEYLKVEVEVSNRNVAENSTMKLLVAGYDETVLTAVDIKTVSKSDESDIYQATLPKNTTAIKAFLWRNLETLVPILPPTPEFSVD